MQDVAPRQARVRADSQQRTVHVRRRAHPRLIRDMPHATLFALRAPAARARSVDY